MPIVSIIKRAPESGSSLRYYLDGVEEYIEVKKKKRKKKKKERKLAEWIDPKANAFARVFSLRFVVLPFLSFSLSLFLPPLKFYNVFRSLVHSSPSRATFDRGFLKTQCQRTLDLASEGILPRSRLNRQADGILGSGSASLHEVARCEVVITLHSNSLGVCTATRED